MVHLRLWRAEDAPALAAAWADPEVQRWTAVPVDRDEEAARRWIAGEAERREQGVALDMVVTADDEVVGEVGLGPIQWDRGRAMIGFWTAAEHRGNGFATQAVGLLVEWAFEHTTLDQIVAETAPRNEASGAVLRANGFSVVVERPGRLAWSRQAVP